MNRYSEGVLLLPFIIVVLAVVVVSNMLTRIECQNTWSAFENRWGFFKGCQIKLGDRWIPAESYYFKEE